MSNRPRRGGLGARSRRGGHVAYILLEVPLHKVVSRWAKCPRGVAHERWSKCWKRKNPERVICVGAHAPAPGGNGHAAPRIGSLGRCLESAERARTAPKFCRVSARCS